MLIQTVEHKLLELLLAKTAFPTSVITVREE